MPPICIDAQVKEEDVPEPVGVWPCHGQGGNQVTNTTDQLPYLFYAIVFLGGNLIICNL